MLGGALWILFSGFAGALWSLIPSLLKIYRGVHEVISTIMLNWISYYAAIYISSNILVDPNRSKKTFSVLESARMSILVLGTTLTSGIYVSLLIAILFYIIISRTVIGYEIALLGSGVDVARYAGVNIRRTIIYSFLLGGFASGIAGDLLLQLNPLPVPSMETWVMSLGMGLRVLV
jgi:ABC-type uncharacterized transport system, permease component